MLRHFHHYLTVVMLDTDRDGIQTPGHVRAIYIVQTFQFDQLNGYRFYTKY